MIGASAVASWVRLLHATPAPQSVTAPLPMQLPAAVLEQHPEVASVLGPCTCKDLEEAPGPWLHPGTALAVVAIWGRETNQKNKLSLSVSASLSATLPVKLMSKSFQKKEIFFNL